MKIFLRLIAVITLAPIASSQSIDSAHLPLDGPDAFHSSTDHGYSFPRAKDSVHSSSKHRSDCPDDTLAAPAHSSAIPEVFFSSAHDSAHFSLVRRVSTNPNVISQLGRSSIPLDHDSAHHRRVARSVSSSENFETSVDRLRAVAHVATGIYLTQELIKGTDKKEEITSELLKLGSVTPAEIDELKYTAVQTAVNGWNDFPKNLSIGNRTRQALQNAEHATIIKNNYVNITDITAWPDKSEIKSILDEIVSFRSWPSLSSSASLWWPPPLVDAHSIVPPHTLL